uniref:Transcription factor MYB10 n=1 Tax=Diospyros kaki TaxID=35925 RepID=A0A2P1ENB5_DIOKA|nr:transcription factor MYB10 [Diospyros kaki]
MIRNTHLFPDKMQPCQDYVHALEEERRKIQVFQRELPLCLELVTQAIEACKQQLSGTTTEYFHGQSECSGDTSSEGPVFEEFFPIKTSSSPDEDEEEQSHKDGKSNDKSSKKSDWLRSVQLWNQTPDPPIKEDSPIKVSVTTNSGGAFHPFKKEKSVGAKPATTASPPSSTPAAAASTTAGGSKKDEKEGQSQRKARRCWSPELHRRFLHALQQLGGSHVATPKQIREIMKVDGLSNDEVKSHLQKYRLHERRPTPPVHNNSNPQAPPQFVVVGGIWVPPPDYAAVATGEGSRAAGANGIYAPIASAPPPLPQPAASRTKGQRPSHSDDRTRSNSPATSSSTRST